jgi:hypothetical protein
MFTDQVSAGLLEHVLCYRYQSNQLRAQRNRCLSSKHVATQSIKVETYPIGLGLVSGQKNFLIRIHYYNYSCNVLDVKRQPNVASCLVICLA